MEMVQESVNLPVELNQVRVAVVKIVKNIASGQNAVSAVLGSLSELEAAVANFQQIPVEVKTDPSDSMTVGALMIRDILAALKK